MRRRHLPLRRFYARRMRWEAAVRDHFQECRRAEVFQKLWQADLVVVGRVFASGQHGASDNRNLLSTSFNLTQIRFI